MECFMHGGSWTHAEQQLLSLTNNIKTYAVCVCVWHEMRGMMMKHILQTLQHGTARNFQVHLKILKWEYI
jgi:hypothetical protein